MQIVTDGILTNYQIIGKKNRPIMLILHGWKRSLIEWLTIAKVLEEKYQVVLLDLPGFGQTGMPQKPFSIYDYATFVEHFLDKLEIKKVSLMGHSFGGRIGIILSAQTKRIENLLLIDAAGIEKRSPVAKMKIAFFKIAKVILPKKFVEGLRMQLGSPDYKSAGAMRTIFLKVINEDLSYLLPDIAIPTLIVWGEMDTEVPLWKTQQMKKQIPHAKLRVVWGADHSPYLGKPKIFNEIIKEYLHL